MKGMPINYWRIDNNYTHLEPANHHIRIRCSACHQKASMEGLTQIRDLHASGMVNRPIIFGIRRCPDPKCHMYSFFVLDKTSDILIASYPPERIDFDSSKIPPLVLRSMEEAIACHSNHLYMSSGMMIRKTLEAICEEQGIKGRDLMTRLQNLKSVVVLPKELMDGLDELRILGNDAAHIESRDYNEIGPDEIEAGIDVAKEILKAVYQHAALIQKLKDLKKK